MDASEKAMRPRPGEPCAQGCGEDPYYGEIRHRSTCAVKPPTPTLREAEEAAITAINSLCCYGCQCQADMGRICGAHLLMAEALLASQKWVAAARASALEEAHAPNCECRPSIVVPPKVLLKHHDDPRCLAWRSR